MDGDALLPFLAACLAAAAALYASFVAKREGHNTRKALDRQRAEDHKIRQVSELYGPMHMLRRESRELWRQLPPQDDPVPGQTDWMLIDHIDEIRNEDDGRRRKVVERILEINDEVAETIQTNAGLLIEFPAPESFENFLVHRSTLRQHWERGRNVEDKISYKPFPDGIDLDIDDAIRQLRTAPKLDKGE